MPPEDEAPRPLACVPVRCAVCRADAPEPYLDCGGYTIVRCRACGLVYTNPCPTEEALTRLYLNYIDPPSKGWVRRLRYAWWMRRIDRCATVFGKLLDIGASQGDFGLAVARNRRWQYHGIEASRVMTAYARSLGLNVTQGWFQEFDFAEEEYALVTMWHVLEHLHDPRAMLTRILRILQPDGLLALQVPDISHPRARYYGRRWKHFEPPVHLWYFSKTTLRRLLEDLGFTVVYARRKPTVMHLTMFARKAHGTG
ncbi:MAG: methyltransferase domain-containing protein [Planctomycetota bacterium]